MRKMKRERKKKSRQKYRKLGGKKNICLRRVIERATERKKKLIDDVYLGRK